jgi:hypothetical protein
MAIVDGFSGSTGGVLPQKIFTTSERFSTPPREICAHRRILNAGLMK